MQWAGRVGSSCFRRREGARSVPVVRTLASVVSIIGLGCASTTEPAPPDLDRSDTRILAVASSTTTASSSASAALSAPPSAAKAALEQAIVEEGKAQGFAWGRLSFAVPLDWRVKRETAAELLEPPVGAGAFVAALMVNVLEPDPLGVLERELWVNDCVWARPELTRVERTKIEAEIVDGTCRRKGDVVSAARVRYATANTAFFVWAKGADLTVLWQIARSVDHLSPQRLAACCAALLANRKSAPPRLIAGFQQAMDICTLDRAGANADTIPKIRAALNGEFVPAACR
jgi:hypothetical protein